MSGQGLEEIGEFLFRGLEIVRVYTKTPGHPPEMDRPFTVRRGATVMDVARLVHKDIAGSLKYARAWGTGVFDGQQIGPNTPSPTPTWSNSTCAEPQRRPEVGACGCVQTPCPRRGSGAGPWTARSAATDSSPPWMAGEIKRTRGLHAPTRRRSMEQSC